MVPQQLGKCYVEHKKDKEREKRASEEQRRQQVGDVEMREKYAIPGFLEDAGFASETSILDVKRTAYNQKLKNAHQKVWDLCCCVVFCAICTSSSHRRPSDSS